MALIEAMACGLAAVSFDCPCGPKDIISDREDGLLVKNGDVNAFSQALIALIQDTSLRERLAGNARQNVQRFRIEEIANRWKSLFEQL